MLIHLTRILTEGIVGGTKIDVVNSGQKKDKANFNVTTYNRLLKDNISLDQDSIDLETFLQEKQDTETRNTLGKTGYTTQVISLVDKQKKPEKDPEIDSENCDQTLESNENSVLEGVWSPPPKQYKSEEQRLYLDYLNKMQKAGQKIKDLDGWPLFNQVFMISALKDDGVEDLKVGHQSEMLVAFIGRTLT